MDLLGLLDSSSGSENDCASSVTDLKTTTPKRLQGPSFENEPSNRSVAKKRRGSISIIPSSKASPTTFQRSIPHRRGHWAGHVMVPVRCFSRGSIHESVVSFRRLLEDHGYSGTVVQQDEYHLSLSRFFSLQGGNIEPFVQKLTERLCKEHSTQLFVDRSGECLVNDERTRTFWSWKVHPNTVLRRIVSHVDDILRQYSQPIYYENPAFHVSIASFAEHVQRFTNHADVTSQPTIDDADNLEGSDDSDYQDDMDHITVDRVYCFFGNTKTYEIRLQSST